MLDHPSRAQIRIGDRLIGPDSEPFIIAEMSGNHDGSLDRALEIVDAVAAAGAHALKLQTYTADTMTIDVDAPAFRISDDHPLWGRARLHQLYERAHTPWEWHAAIFDRARELGLLAFSSAFDSTAIEFLESLDVPAYKVASSEIVDLPLIRQIAATGKPVIISTGMATLTEIDAAVSAARQAGATELVVLACTTSYPASPEDSNLRRIPLMGDAFDVVVGLSDHTEGVGVAIASVAFGASVIEKHVTLSRDDGSVDSAFSMEPPELGVLVRESRHAWQALGAPRFGPTDQEAEGLRFRRSLYVVEDVRAGDRVSPTNVRSIRPAGGLVPEMADTVMGRTFTCDVARGTPLSWDVI
jgi:N-acetylneuraminate synthase